MPDELDRALVDLHHELSNVSTMNNICISMKDNTTKLLAALRTPLEDTKTVIDAALHVLPLALLLVLPGCVFDVNKAMQEWAKPTTSFEQPPAWDCDKTVKISGKRGIEECTICRNATTDVQAVTVNKERIGVHPSQAVYLCPWTVVLDGRAL
jgi:hypothetical protein